MLISLPSAVTRRKGAGKLSTAEGIGGTYAVLCEPNRTGFGVGRFCFRGFLGGVTAALGITAGRLAEGNVSVFVPEV